MKLFNGRGLLGEALSKVEDDSDWLVYHTWNVIDLEDDEIQNNEFDKFKKFVDEHKEEKICYISSSYVKDTVYLLNKIRAEAYLIENVKDFKIIRPPHYLGKGIFKAFRDGELPWDNSLVDIINMKDVCREIVKCLHNDSKFTFIRGEDVSKGMIHSLIQYGVNNVER